MNEIDRLKKENEKLKGELDSLKKIMDDQTAHRKKRMDEKASKGKIMSRAPFGYIVEDKKLVPAGNFTEVEDIFSEFLNEKMSLRQIAEKHKLSVNGLKKILRNFTYIGKLKFSNQIHLGSHKPIVSTTLFNHVQNKLERLGIK